MTPLSIRHQVVGICDKFLNLCNSRKAYPDGIYIARDTPGIQGSLSLSFLLELELEAQVTCQ
jgi:hypothetical protein